MTDKARYIAYYHKTKVRRVSINFQHEQYDLIKEAADSAGETVSGYIREALKTRMEADGFRLLTTYEARKERELEMKKEEIKNTLIANEIEADEITDELIEELAKIENEDDLMSAVSQLYDVQTCTLRLPLIDELKIWNMGISLSPDEIPVHRFDDDQAFQIREGYEHGLGELIKIYTGRKEHQLHEPAEYSAEQMSKIRKALEEAVKNGEKINPATFIVQKFDSLYNF